MTESEGVLAEGLTTRPIEAFSGGVLAPSSKDVNPGSWVMRKDEDYVCQSLDQICKNREEVTTVAQLQDLLSAAAEKENSASRARLWVSLPLETLPSELPACMSIKSLRSQLENEGIIMSVLSYSGYSFSSEYLYVYKGIFRSVRAYEDLVGVTQKAIRSIDPSLDSEQEALFANYLVRKAAWTSQYFIDLVQKAVLEKTACECTAHKRFDFDFVRIYLGRYAGQLVATIRLENTVYFKDKDLSTEELQYFCVAYFNVPLETQLVQRFEDTVLSRASDRRQYLEIEEALAGPASSVRLFIVPPVAESLLDTSAFPEEGAAAEGFSLEEAEVLWAQYSAPSEHFRGGGTGGDLVGWGLDSYSVLGLQKAKPTADPENDLLPSPHAVPLPRSLALERVSMIACSARHTLLLTTLGSMYACGDNSEGALGLGDLIPRTTFTPVDWPAEKPKPRFIAVGAGVLGCHSMAIDGSGSLYGWGLSKAVGLGSVKPVLSPTVVPVRAWSLDFENAVDQCVWHVACGDAFTVCLTSLGTVFAWGQWAHGRLGLGPVPTVTAQRQRSKSPKLAKYQLSPMQVPGISTARQVSAGAAHVLCLLSSGHVLAWGNNILGQLGIGYNRTGMLKDCFSPVLVPGFGEAVYRRGGATARSPLSTWRSFLPKDPAESVEQSLAMDGPKAARVVCGSFHSVVMDAAGAVYSWGARGSPCLGHGDIGLDGPWGKRVSVLFSPHSTEPSAMVPHELLPWVGTWSRPRPIACLRGVHIRQIVCGDLSTAVLTSDRQVLLCGSGPVVPIFNPPTRWLDAEASEETEAGDDGEGKATAGAQTDKPSAEEPTTISGSLVSALRAPSSCWMRELSNRSVHYLSSSACHAFALLSHEVVVDHLTTEMFSRLVYTSARSPHVPPPSSGGSLSGDEQSDAELLQPTDQIPRILESRGLADCLVITSGYLFLAHKAFLAHRSPVLREMIILESSSDPLDDQMVQLLLPELTKDSGRAFHYFLYHDDLPAWSTGRTLVVHALQHVASTLRIPRLTLLCAQVLRGQLDEAPPRALTQHLGSLLGDPEFSDVKFIAEGRSIAAHRFVLEAKSEYFRTMFRSGMLEGSSGMAGRRQIIDVAVPGRQFVASEDAKCYIFSNVSYIPCPSRCLASPFSMYTQIASWAFCGC